MTKQEKGKMFYETIENLKRMDRLSLIIIKNSTDTLVQYQQLQEIEEREYKQIES